MASNCYLCPGLLCFSRLSIDPGWRATWSINWWIFCLLVIRSRFFDFPACCCSNSTHWVTRDHSVGLGNHCCASISSTLLSLLGLKYWKSCQLLKGLHKTLPYSFSYFTLPYSFSYFTLIGSWILLAFGLGKIGGDWSFGIICARPCGVCTILMSKLPISTPCFCVLCSCLLRNG